MVWVSEAAGEVAGVVAVAAASDQGTIAAVAADASTGVAGADDKVLAGDDDWGDDEEEGGYVEGHCRVGWLETWSLMGSSSMEMWLEWTMFSLVKKNR